MRSEEIRSTFLRFFEERGHRIVPSSSLVPAGDPTLLFTNAGMVQFKRVFLGEETREYTRAASCQKCMRVSGKHNDLENVGRTPRHHTFFEMLGNFSFGDYFKREAIAYAWELLTGVFGLPRERLVVSVFREDDEAYAIWRDAIGLPEERIFRLDEKENFWQMGDTGPCGPCSEIHWILDEEAFRAGADPTSDAFLEIWNLVFMQYDQAADGTRRPLPRPSIDTGMGLERIAAVLQGVPSNYDTDLFAPLIRAMEEIAGRRYGKDEAADVSFRVVADHARACAFLIGDGVLPSNEGRGYVLRRVLRRASRHGVLLGVEEPFLYRIAERVIERMGPVYPELEARRAFILETIRGEEERFLRTLRRGLELLERELEAARAAGRTRLPGEVVFRLYDTYGFPVDLTEDILRGEGFDWDREGFERAMREQTERARAAWKGTGEAAPPEIYAEIARRVRCEFVGYDTLEARSTVEALLVGGREVESAREGEAVELVAPVTPFYPEGGGQVGDVGTIRGPKGIVEVEDTRRPVEGLIVHRGRVRSGEIRRGDAIELEVDAETRAATVRNHSGTHLLHAALKRVLGPHVQQAGSLVAPDRLRFDFTFDRALTPEEIRAIEDEVNRVILADVHSTIERMGYREALEAGAVAIFEEKYGDVVRVVRFGPYSAELCGGTHARSTGEIGLLRIVGQSAVGAGVRRIEAVTGFGVLESARRDAELLREAAARLRTTPAELPQRIERLLERERELERELERLRAELRGGVARSDPLAEAREVGGVRVLAKEIPDASPKELRALVDELKARIGSGAVLLATRAGGKAAFACGVTDDLTGRLRAGELVREVAKVVGGSGGGRADFAQAGGPRAEALPEALARFEALVRERLGR